MGGCLLFVCSCSSFWWVSLILARWFSECSLSFLRKAGVSISGCPSSPCSSPHLAFSVNCQIKSELLLMVNVQITPYTHQIGYG